MEIISNLLLYSYVLSFYFTCQGYSVVEKYSEPILVDSVEVYQNLCSENFEYLADPLDCHYFIFCSNKLPYRQKCSNSLYWNQEMRSCSWSKKSCAKAVASAVIRKERAMDNVAELKKLCDKGGQYHADPYDCHYFIQCSNGIPVRQKCPSSLYWNQQLLTCQWTGSHCSEQLATTTTRLPTVTTETITEKLTTTIEATKQSSTLTAPATTDEVTANATNTITPQMVTSMTTTTVITEILNSTLNTAENINSTVLSNGTTNFDTTTATNFKSSTLTTDNGTLETTSVISNRESDGTVSVTNTETSPKRPTTTSSDISNIDSNTSIPTSSITTFTTTIDIIYTRTIKIESEITTTTKSENISLTLATSTINANFTSATSKPVSSITGEILTTQIPPIKSITTTTTFTTEVQTDEITEAATTVSLSIGTKETTTEVPTTRTLILTDIIIKPKTTLSSLVSTQEVTTEDSIDRTTKSTLVVSPLISTEVSTNETTEISSISTEKTKCNEGDIDPSSNCEYYIQCINGIPVTIKCSNGTYWNNEIAECTLDNSRCFETTTLFDTSSFSIDLFVTKPLLSSTATVNFNQPVPSICNDGITYHPDPHDCHYFIQCSNFVPYRMKCAEPLYWQQSKLSCVWSNSHCKYQLETTTAITVTETTNQNTETTFSKTSIKEDGTNTETTTFNATTTNASATTETLIPSMSTEIATQIPTSESSTQSITSNKTSETTTYISSTSNESSAEDRTSIGATEVITTKTISNTENGNASTYSGSVESGNDLIMKNDPTTESSNKSTTENTLTTEVTKSTSENNSISGTTIRRNEFTNVSSTSNGSTEPTTKSTPESLAASSETTKKVDSTNYITTPDGLTTNTTGLNGTTEDVHINETTGRSTSEENNSTINIATENGSSVERITSYESIERSVLPISSTDDVTIESTNKSNPENGSNIIPTDYTTEEGGSNKTTAVIGSNFHTTDELITEEIAFTDNVNMGNNSTFETNARSEPAEGSTTIEVSLINHTTISDDLTVEKNEAIETTADITSTDHTTISDSLTIETTRPNVTAPDSTYKTPENFSTMVTSVLNTTMEKTVSEEEISTYDAMSSNATTDPTNITTLDNNSIIITDETDKNSTVIVTGPINDYY